MNEQEEITQREIPIESYKVLMRCNLARDVLRWAKHLKEQKSWEFKAVGPDVHGFFTVGQAYADDQQEMKFNPETGIVKLAKWDVSYHNGDPYNYRESVMDEDDSINMLKALKDRLENAAVELEVKRTEEEQKRQRHETTLKDLKARLGW